jgi:putative transposase
MKERKTMIERDSDQLSMRRQCSLVGVNRNRLAPPLDKPGAVELKLCRLIDEIHMKAPTFGSRKIRDLLLKEYDIRTTRGRVRHLMGKMGIRATYRAPRTSLPGKGSEHKVYPYLLRGQKVEAPDEVWCTDITYIPMERGHAYLVAIMDWHTRAVISWRLSNTLDTRFCLEAFDDAVRVAGRAPEIFNTDQGCQFTSRAWRERLTSHGIAISMDGKGRWLDNVFIERLWRTLKHDELHLREFDTLPELETILGNWFKLYNTWRPHDSLGGSRPWEIYRPKVQKKAA